MKVKVGIIQLTSELDFEINLKKIDGSIKELKQNGVEYIFLPECFYSMSNGLTPTPHLVEEGNEHWKNIASLAKTHSVYLLGGSVAYLENGKIKNRCLNFNPKGELVDWYDKIHLFSCELGEGQKKVINESNIYTPGKTPKIISAGPLKIGLSICFDLRYPTMYREYVESGANLLTVSAAFTVPTGKAHWHILNRARAIENQCFVLAPAQYGRHNERIQTFGHSLIIGPWGEVLVDAGEGEKCIHAELELDEINRVRQSVKVF